MKKPTPQGDVGFMALKASMPEHKAFRPTIRPVESGFAQRLDTLRTDSHALRDPFDHQRDFLEARK